MKKTVDKVSRFLCAGHCSLLAGSREGGKEDEHCNLKYDHLNLLVPLKIANYYTLNL